jgi:flagellar biosynthesis protein FliP
MKPLTFGVGLFTLLAVSTGAIAQVPQLPLENGQVLPGGGQITAQIIQYVVLITALSIAPGLVVMLTSFTRIIIALSFLRSGLGLQTTPSTILLVTLAMFLTMFIWKERYRNRMLMSGQFLPFELSCSTMCAKKSWHFFKN